MSVEIKFGLFQRGRIHQENLKILFYTFLHFFVKKLKKV